MADQAFSEVFANVVDLGVEAEPGSRVSTPTTNTYYINQALASASEVVFPAGTYRFLGVLRFASAGQRCRFLAGAILEPANSDSYVLVSGANQVITGLRIECPRTLVARSPLLEIYGAGGLLLQDLEVSAPRIAVPAIGPPMAVRVMYLTRCVFLRGTIRGGGEPDTVGLALASSYDYSPESPNPNPGQWMTTYPDSGAIGDAQRSSGAYEVGAFGLAISQFGWGVRIGCVTDNPTFVNCAFWDNTQGALLVRGDSDVLGDPALVVTATHAKALVLIGCRAWGDDPAQYIEVAADGSAVMGGAIQACTFGTDSTGTDGTFALPTGFGPLAGTAPTGIAGLGGPKLKPAPARPAAGSRLAGSPSSVASSPPAVVPAPRRPALPNPRSAGTDRRVAATPPGLPDASPGREKCIIRINGYAYGLVVSGCHSNAEDGRWTVWQLPDSAGVTNTCDMFNHWAEAHVASGTRAGRLVQLGSSSTGELTLVAAELRVDSDLLGFFKHTAVPPNPIDYSIGTTTPGRTLNSASVQPVLAQLLLDLADLGLIKAG